jgi:hypothetical protein
MPVTPQQALSKSPAAHLTEDEREQFDRFKERIDGLLSTTWPGGPWQIGTEPCSQRVMAYVVRAYQTAGWNIGIAAVDGAMAKAAELIAAGTDVRWQLTFIPDWSRS